jgi:hypothetical protein
MGGRLIAQPQAVNDGWYIAQPQAVNDGWYIAHPQAANGGRLIAHPQAANDNRFITQSNRRPHETSQPALSWRTCDPKKKQGPFPDAAIPPCNPFLAVGAKNRTD